MQVSQVEAPVEELTKGDQEQKRRRRLVASVPRWHHTFEVFPGITTNGSAYNPGFIVANDEGRAQWRNARV